MVSNSVRIEVGIDRVWELLVESFEWLLPDSSSTLSILEQIDTGVISVGTSAWLALTGPQKRLWKIAELDRPNVLAWQSKIGPTALLARHDLSGDENATQHLFSIEVSGFGAGTFRRFSMANISATVAAENEYLKATFEEDKTPRILPIDGDLPWVEVGDDTAKLTFPWLPVGPIRVEFGQQGRLPPEYVVEVKRLLTDALSWGTSTRIAVERALWAHCVYHGWLIDERPSAKSPSEIWEQTDSVWEYVSVKSNDEMEPKGGFVLSYLPSPQWEQEHGCQICLDREGTVIGVGSPGDGDALEQMGCGISLDVLDDDHLHEVQLGMTESEVEWIFAEGDVVPDLKLDVFTGVWFEFRDKRLSSFSIRPSVLDHFGPFVFGQTREQIGIPADEDGDDGDSEIQVIYNGCIWSLRMFDGVLWYLKCVSTVDVETAA
jgi:hypothetical protein